MYVRFLYYILDIAMLHELSNGLDWVGFFRQCDQTKCWMWIETGHKCIFREIFLSTIELEEMAEIWETWQVCPSYDVVYWHQQFKCGWNLVGAAPNSGGPHSDINRDTVTKVEATIWKIAL